jgi:hypothetical protein
MLTQLSVGQDCSLIRSTDAYTKLSTISTGHHSVSGGTLLMDANKPEIDWMIEVGNGNLCFDDAATIQVFFEGSKQRLMFRNAGTMNCEGLLHVLFKNGPSTNYQLSRMASLPIQRIVISKSDEPDKKEQWSIELDATQRVRWMKSVSCLIDESKKLLTQ